MPLVRCPDCGREIEVSREDLSSVIECAICEARFGPLLPRAPTSPLHAALAATENSNEDYVTERMLPRSGVRPKRQKAKPRLRVLPILLGIVVGAGATAALAFSIYAALKYAQPVAEKANPAKTKEAGRDASKARH
jgi:hypothetical protein